DRDRAILERIRMRGDERVRRLRGREIEHDIGPGDHAARFLHGDDAFHAERLRGLSARDVPIDPGDDLDILLIARKPDERLAHAATDAADNNARHGVVTGAIPTSSSAASSADRCAGSISTRGSRSGPTSKPSQATAALTGMGFGSTNNARMSGRYCSCSMRASS